MRRSVVWGLAVGLLVGVAYLLGALERMELLSFDLRLSIRGNQEPRAPIILVSIDEDSFQELGLRWPWPRSLHARLIERIAAGRPKAIGLDIVFPEPTLGKPAEDGRLGRAVAAAGNVVLGAQFVDVATEVEGGVVRREKIDLPIPKIREGAAGIGLVNVDTDSDGFVRRVRLSKTLRGFENEPFRHLAVELAALAPTEAARSLLANPGLGEFIINYRGPARLFETVPYYQVVRGELPPEVFAGKFVLVGAYAPVLQDLFSTPVSPKREMPGVAIQASILDTILAGDPIREVPNLLARPLLFGGRPPNLIYFALALLIAAGTAVITDRFRPFKAFRFAVGIGLAYALVAYAAFAWVGLWIEVAPILASLAGTYGIVALKNHVREEREKRQISRFFSPAVAEEIVKARGGDALNARRRSITILFSDIRDFTTISERLTPEEVVALLREYFNAMTSIVFKHGGAVDKFVGDAIMGLFGAPIAYPDHAVRAVRTALEMAEKVPELSPQWEAKCGKALRIGVGINSGEPVVGAMGSDHRLEYSAIGDPVNLASRLEGVNKEFGTTIVISETTYQAVKDHFRCRPLSQLKVKGRTVPLQVYTVEPGPPLAEGGAEEPAPTRKEGHAAAVPPGQGGSGPAAMEERHA